MVYLICLLTLLTEEMQQYAKVVLNNALRLPWPDNLEGHLLDAEDILSKLRALPRPQKIQSGS